MITYADYPPFVAADIARLRRRIEASDIPPKISDSNLLIASWNIRSFGDLFESFEENPGSPKRNLRGLAYIAEVVRCFDVIALQEIRRETSAVRRLMDDFLGPDWALILSDVTVGDRGNAERLGFLYDTRRVSPSGLAGEVVLPPTADGDPVEQFDRTPYLVGFQAGGRRFTLLTAHIRFSDDPEDRIPELEAFAAFTARELRDRSRFPGAEESNLIVLGDFNIDRRGDNPLFQAFIQEGLVVPEPLRGMKTTTGQDAKFYDQIAWFMGDMGLVFNDRAGVIDFVGAVYKELGSRQLPSRLSDHFPLWVELITDRSIEQLATVLGIDPAMPDPLGPANVPE